MITGIVASAAAFVPPANPMDDEFEGVTLDPKWTWRQQHSATAVVGSDVLTMTADPATADPTVQQIFQSFSGPAVFRSLFAGMATVDFAIVGLHLRNSTTGALCIFGFHHNSGGQRLVAIRFANETTYSANIVEAIDPDPLNPQFIEVEVTATHLIFRTSLDGSTWIERLNETLATFIGAAVDEVGFAVCAFGASSPSIVADWFRKVG